LQKQASYNGLIIFRIKVVYLNFGNQEIQVWKQGDVRILRILKDSFVAFSFCFLPSH
jgi:hypothetical protein